MSFIYSVIRYIYFLPIPEILFIICVTTFIYAFILNKCKRIAAIKIFSIVLLLLWLSAVLYVTIFLRTVGEESRYKLVPFYSYWCVFINGEHPRRLRSNFMNIVLFYPLGMLIGSFIDNKKSGKKIIVILLIMVTISIGIEIVQYKWSLGYAETDDVIHNMLGGILGMFSLFLFRAFIS